jgi:hypothetical protein
LCGNAVRVRSGCPVHKNAASLCVARYRQFLNRAFGDEI